MKAMVCARYGPPEVLQLADVPKPIPGTRDVLIRVRATSVTAGDYRIRGLNVPAGFGIPLRLMVGFTRPRNPILGMNFAGEVEAVGKDVRMFRPGERVFGTSSMRFGAYAEYLSLPQTAALATMPANMSYEQGAAFPFGMLTALFFLRDKGRVRAGERVLIYGASGAVGTATVQLAKCFGAEVAAVCSTANLDMVMSLGADHVMDYTHEDFTLRGDRYDIIFDTVGKTPFARSLRALNDNGRYLLAVAGIPRYLRILFTVPGRGRRILAGTAGDNRDDLLFLRGLFESGKLRPVIDRLYPFEQLPEAHRYAESGHKRGNVVVVL